MRFKRALRGCSFTKVLARPVPLVRQATGNGGTAPQVGDVLSRIKQSLRRHQNAQGQRPLQVNMIYDS